MTIAIPALRDDGPLARALGDALGRAIRLPALVLAVAGALPLLALLAIGQDDASDVAAGAAIGWFVLVAGISSGRPHTGRMSWGVPPVLRLAEYAAVLWLAALAGGGAPAAAFALLAAVAFRHYDLVYRARYLGTLPPAWLGDVAGGWDGRLLVAWFLFATGALPAGFFALAGFFGVLFATESVLAWSRGRNEARGTR